MRAVVFDRPGDETVLLVGEVEDPEPGAGQVLIATAAAGINRADLLQRRGLYPPPDGVSPILGLECAGRIAAVGAGVRSWRAGDRVMALLAGGGYAERVVVDERCVMATPDRLTDTEAAAVPEVFLTAFLNLFQLGGLKAGDVALVHGGSGGVGTAAIQLVRAASATALVTAGSAERCRRCVELGAHLAIDHRAEDFAERCREATGGRGVDVVLDCIGAAYLESNLSALAPDGRLVVIGLMGGARAELDLARLLQRRLTVIGSTLRARSPTDKGAMIAAFLERFGDRLRSGAVRPILDRTLPLEAAGEAHRLLATGAIFGKLVLTTS